MLFPTLVKCSEFTTSCMVLLVVAVLLFSNYGVVFQVVFLGSELVGCVLSLHQCDLSLWMWMISLFQLVNGPAVPLSCSNSVGVSVCCGLSL